MALVPKAGVDLVHFRRSSSDGSTNSDPLNDSGVGDVDVCDGDFCTFVVVSMNMRLSQSNWGQGASDEENIDRGGLHLGQQGRFVFEMVSVERFSGGANL